MALWKFVSVGRHLTSYEGPKRRQMEKLSAILASEGRAFSVKELSDRSGYAERTIATTLYLMQKTLGNVKIETYETGPRKDIASLYQYACVSKWLNELKQGDYVKKCKYVFYDYLDYLKRNSKYSDPETLIEDALDSNSRQLIKHVEMMKAYIKTKSDISQTSREKLYEVLRSFYVHNQVGLPRSPLPRENTIDTEISKKDIEPAPLYKMIKQMVQNASERDKAIILVITQGALDDSTLANVFNVLAYAQLADHFGTIDFEKWDEKLCPVRIYLRRPKTAKQFYTYIHKDAINALKAWLKVRRNITRKEIEIYKNQRSDHIPRSDPIFIVRGGKPLKPYLVSKIFHDCALRSGAMNKHTEKVERFKGARIRYPLHSHEVRDALKSLASSMGLGQVAEFFLGHEIDKLHYDKSPRDHEEHYRESYNLMAPHLNIVSNDPDKIKLEKKVETLEAENKDIKMNLENQLYIMNARLEKQAKRQDIIDAVMASPEMAEILRQTEERKKVLQT